MLIFHVTDQRATYEIVKATFHVSFLDQDTAVVFIPKRVKSDKATGASPLCGGMAGKTSGFAVKSYGTKNWRTGFVCLL